MSKNDEIMDFFRVFDKDGNGLITASEIRQAMSNLGMNLDDKQIQQMIKAADVDGDGQINYKGNFKKAFFFKSILKPFLLNL